MNLLALATLVALQGQAAGKELPIRLPDGWESRTQDGVVLVTPKQVPEGKVYAVMIPPLTRKVGTLRGLLDAAKETLGEVGTFKPATDPVSSKTDGQWDYEIVIGTLEKGGRTFLWQATGLKKGEEEGVILVLADSLETMQTYADGMAALLKSVGAPKAAPAAAGTAKATQDLKYVLPAGWEIKDQGGTVLLEKWENKGETFYGNQRQYILLILPGAALEGTLRKTFLETWKAVVKPAVETSIAPLPLMRRLKSGLAVAYDADDRAKNKNGNALIVGLYLLSQGKKVVPIYAVFSGTTSTAMEADLLALLESATIPGAGSEKAALFDAADVAGEWEKSSYSMASYVTSGGAYAGDASIAIGEYFTLNKDATFKYRFIGLGRVRVNVKEEGTWKIDGESLVLTDPKSEKRYRLFGWGTDAKAAQFLVMSVAAGTQEQLDLCAPRRMFSGSWFKKKE